MAAPERARVFAAVLFLAGGIFGGASLANAQIGAANTRTLLWTAPGDDANVGRASHYEIHYSTTPIPDTADTLTYQAWWSGSTILSSSLVPPPSYSGQADSAHVTNLSYGSTYYFVLRTEDDAQNWSYYSNVAVATLPSCAAPATTPTVVGMAPDSAGAGIDWSGNDPLATRIQIYRGLTPAPLSLLTTLPSSETHFDDTSVSKGVTYYYALAWAADCGNGPLGSPNAVTIPSNTHHNAPPAQGTATVAAYPNPSQGAIRFVVDVQGTSSLQGTIWLYDMNGHRVALLAQGSFAAGSSSFTWDRLSSSGHTVAPGYYEAIGTIGGNKVRERLILLP